MTKATLIQLPLEQLQRGRYQPRRHFDPEALQELADSIRANGLIQAIVVRPISSSRYEIIAGERRWRASQLAGLNTINCLVKNYSDEQAAAITSVENIQRQDLNPIEEAQSLARLIDEFDYSHEEVAAVIGRSRAKVSNQLRLLKLSEPVQQLLTSEQLSEGHGKLLATLSASQQLDLANQAIKHDWSVHKLTQRIKKDRNADKSTSQKHADIARLERFMSDYLGSKVEVDTNSDNEGGWLKVKYYGNDTLVGIIEKMGLTPDEGVD